MKCPDCGEEMAREDGAILKNRGPNASYTCEECGAEFYWEKDVRGLQRVAEGVPNAFSIFERSR